MKKLFPYCCIVVAMLSGCSDSQSPPASIPSAEVVQQKLSHGEEHYFSRDELYRIYSAPGELFQGARMTLGQVRSSMFTHVRHLVHIPICDISPVRIDPRAALSLLERSLSPNELYQFSPSWKKQIMHLPLGSFPLYAEVPYSESNGVLFFPQNPFLRDSDERESDARTCETRYSDFYSREGRSCRKSRPLTILLPRIRKGGLPDDLEVPCYVDYGEQGADGCCFCDIRTVWRNGSCDGVNSHTCRHVPKCCHGRHEFWTEPEAYCPRSGPGLWWFRDPQPIGSLPVSRITKRDNDQDNQWDHFSTK